MSIVSVVLTRRVVSRRPQARDQQQCQVALEIDERLVASTEVNGFCRHGLTQIGRLGVVLRSCLFAFAQAVGAFQRAADAARRNARRLTVALEREQSLGMGGPAQAKLEQRVNAANAAASALQHRLSVLERAHERKQV